MALVILEGSNGSGKTMMLRQLLMRNGHTPESPLPIISVPPVVGSAFVPQSKNRILYASRVYSLLATPLVVSGSNPRLVREKITKLLDTFGFAALLHRSYFTLSGGERQIIQLLSAFSWGSGTVLADDPISLLDSDRAALVCGLFNEFLNRAKDSALVVSRSSAHHWADLAAPAQVVSLDAPGMNISLLEKLRGCLEGHTISRDGGEPSVAIRKFTMAIGGRNLIENASVKFCSRTLHILTGENGSGKTELLRSLSGNGSTTIAGTAQLIAAGTAERPRPGKNVVLIPHDVQCLIGSGNVLEECGSARQNPEWWNKILLLLESERFIRPGVTAYDLSFGERQFVTLLKVLSFAARTKSVKWLLVDEPDASLDPIRASIIIELLAWFVSKLGLCILVTTHNPELYQYCQPKRWQISEKRLMEMTSQ